MCLVDGKKIGSTKILLQTLLTRSLLDETLQFVRLVFTDAHSFGQNLLERVFMKTELKVRIMLTLYTQQLTVLNRHQVFMPYM